MHQRQVPFFDYAGLYLEHGDEIRQVIESVLSRGAFILQAEVTRFEEQLAGFLGVSHVIGVANCTDGLELILRALELKAGDEVLLPSHTFVATAAAVRMTGAAPVFVEVGPDHMIDPGDLERRITGRSRAIIPVSLNGRVCRMAEVLAVARQSELLVVEDAAQALGATLDGKKAGTFGVAAAFSFYPAKLLGAFGDAGAVVTSDPELGERVRLMRDHGRDAHGQVQFWGRNSRLDNLQAAVLSWKLERLSVAIERRRTLAGIYDEGLHDVAEVVLPPGPKEDERHFDVYQNYEIEAEARDELQSFLKEAGIQAPVQWGGRPVHAWEGLEVGVRLPVTESLFERLLMLPLHERLSDLDVEYVVETIRRFYGRS